MVFDEARDAEDRAYVIPDRPRLFSFAVFIGAIVSTGG